LQDIDDYNMSSSKLIVVIGATGTQGGSVTDTFLKDDTWRVRGITRNTGSDAAKKLSEKGVEVVAANLDDTSSLVSTFQGADVVFSVTDFWQPYMNPANREKAKPGQALNEWAYEYEQQQGMNVFDAAAKTEGLERLVFSTLPGPKKWSNGKLNKVRGDYNSLNRQ